MCQWVNPELTAFAVAVFLDKTFTKLTESRIRRTETLQSVSVERITISKSLEHIPAVKPIIRSSQRGPPLMKQQKYNILAALGKYLSLAVLCFAGSNQPSLPNAVYFLSFMVFATLLACNKFTM